MNLQVGSRQAFIGAGANLGDRLGVLTGATARLRASKGIHSVESSSVYETAPVGYLEQPAFLNLVIGVETSLAPEELMTLLLAIEQEFGRMRTVRWGPRTLDLDLLAYENEIRSTVFLELPHPRIFERAFVTVPLGELLGREHFRNATWDTWRDRLAMQKAGSGVRLFSSQAMDAP